MQSLKNDLDSLLQFTETTMAGIGFGLGMAVVMDPPTAQVMMNAGTYYWGGAFSTAFYIDPVDQVRSELP